ncbi:MAG TPA: hypothetical protein VK897_15325 [Anaerolineales bacterium]|nr:hypothetical protein [Anaerolineales bacterium]
MIYDYHSLLNTQKAELEAAIDASTIQIFGSNQLREFLQNIISTEFRNVPVTANQLKQFLINYSHLREIAFQTPRKEILYIWRTVDEYQLLFKIRPKGYYSHLSALYFHGLLDYEPRSIYFNHEQSARLLSTGTLEQSRIDNAFRKKQRITTARTVYDGKEYWLLNGKQTGNYGVILKQIPAGIKVPVTNLERTLIDITVRPAYAGGAASVLQAYRLAQSKLSIDKLQETLLALDYLYPYHQSIGFYIDLAGNYRENAIKKFLDYDSLKYDFYLNYEMKEPKYSKKWRIYYPNDLT